MDQRSRQTGKKDSRANRSLLLRVVFLLCVCGVALFIPLVWQLYKLQITEHDYYQNLAVEYQTSDTTVTANRGTIYDANGETLAISATVYNLILSPRDALEKQESVDEQAAKDPDSYWNVNETIVDYLTSEFGISEERVRSQLEKTTYQYIVMVTDIEDDQAKEIRSFISENKLTYALYLSPTTKRYYPYSATASHVIGFLGYTEDSGDQKVGAYGVEANYEEVLSGKAGRVVTAKNASGTEMLSSYQAYMDAEDGSDITLTIDAQISPWPSRHWKPASRNIM